jgi:hypothetical protein
MDRSRDSHFNLYKRFLSILYPLFSTTEEEYAAVVAESKVRLLGRNTKHIPPVTRYLLSNEKGNVLYGAY